MAEKVIGFKIQIEGLGRNNRNGNAIKNGKLLS
jgi:hypothetical protein